MSKPSIEKVIDPEKRSHSVFSEIEQLTDRIRRRAYELFESDHFFGASDIDDWLAAEREICWPSAELRETDDAFTYEVALPGFSAKDVNVTATPDDLVVRAERRDANKPTKRKPETVDWSDFQYRTAWRRVQLPQPIDVERVKAKLERGMLEILAPKAELAAESTGQHDVPDAA